MEFFFTMEGLQDFLSMTVGVMDGGVIGAEYLIGGKDSLVSHFLY